MKFFKIFFDVIGKLLGSLVVFIFGALFIVESFLVPLRLTVFSESYLSDFLSSEEAYKVVETTLFEKLNISDESIQDESGYWTVERFQNLLHDVITQEVWESNVRNIVAGIFSIARGENEESIIDLDVAVARENFKVAFVDAFSGLPECTEEDLESRSLEGPPTCRTPNADLDQLAQDESIQQQIDNIAVRMLPEQIELRETLSKDVSFDQLEATIQKAYRIAYQGVVILGLLLVILILLSAVLTCRSWKTMPSFIGGVLITVSSVSLVTALLARFLGVEFAFDILSRNLDGISESTQMLSFTVTRDILWYSMLFSLLVLLVGIGCLVGGYLIKRKTKKEPAKK